MKHLLLTLSFLAISLASYSQCTSCEFNLKQYQPLYDSSCVLSKKLENQYINIRLEADKLEKRLIAANKAKTEYKLKVEEFEDCVENEARLRAKEKAKKEIEKALDQAYPRTTPKCKTCK